jgi:hypothetical protein
MKNPSRGMRGTLSAPRRLSVVLTALALTGVGALLAPRQGWAQSPGPAARGTGDWRMPTPGQPPPASPQPPPPAGGYAPQPGGYAPATVTTPPTGYGPPPSTAPAPDTASEPAQAQDEEPTGPFFDLSADTVVPIALGGGVSLEVPGRILLQGDLGWMPPGYGKAINGLVQSFGAYDPSVGALVGGALQGAFVARVSAGWRPFPSHGFEITGGYTYVGLTGSVDATDVAAALGGGVATGLAARAITDPIELSSHLHNFHVALGWRWVAWEHLVIRATVGYMQTLGSSSSVNIPGQPELTAQASPIVNDTLGAIYKSYVKLPFLGLSAGYRF